MVPERRASEDVVVFVELRPMVAAAVGAFCPRLLAVAGRMAGASAVETQPVVPEDFPSRAAVGKSLFIPHYKAVVDVVRSAAEAAWAEAALLLLRRRPHSLGQI